MRGQATAGTLALTPGENAACIAQGISPGVDHPIYQEGDDDMADFDLEYSATRKAGRSHTQRAQERLGKALKSELGKGPDLKPGFERERERERACVQKPRWKRSGLL